MPGELFAIAKRNASASCSPFMPTEPLSQGQWTIVFIYEHRLQHEQRQRFRCSFATLDAHGETKVLDAAGFLREFDLQGSVTESEWNRCSEKVCQEVERKQREWDEWFEEYAPLNPGSGVARDPSRLGLCSAWEVDELFTALGSVGRLASPVRR